MNKLLVVFLIMLKVSYAATVTPTGIPLDKSWKVKLNDFALKNVVHQSWGYPHAERNFHNTLSLAKLEGIAVDGDVLLAAALLHDIGGLPPFEQVGVDHGIRSAEVAEPLLLSIGFPANKIEAVKEIIIGHIYYGPKPTSAIAQLFRDADILDFLGAMGVSRILAANLELGKNPAVENSIKTLRTMMEKLPGELSSQSAKAEATIRLREMRAFLTTLERYSFQGRAY